MVRAACQALKRRGKIMRQVIAGLLLVALNMQAAAKPVRSGYDCVVTFKDAHELALHDVWLLSWEKPSLDLKLTDGTTADVPFNRIDRFYVLGKTGQYTRHLRVILTGGAELQGSIERGVDTAAEGSDSNGLLRKVDAGLVDFVRIVHPNRHRWLGKAFDGNTVTDVTITTDEDAVVSVLIDIDLFCRTRNPGAMSFLGSPAPIIRSTGEGQLTGPPSFTFEGSVNTPCGLRSLTVTGYHSSPTTLNGFAAIKPPENPDRPFVARPLRWNADRQ
jgi:hypothetical protein